MVTCPQGHWNPDDYNRCGQCGSPVTPRAHPQQQWHQPRAAIPPVPFQGWYAPASAASKRGWRAWPRSVQIGVIAAASLALLAGGFAVSQVLSASSGGPGGHATASGTPHEWISSVCSNRPLQIRRDLLPLSTTIAECFSPHGNPIFIGTYESASAMETDVRGLHSNPPYATGVDGLDEKSWLFVAFEDSNPGSDARRALDPNYVPTTPAALKPLAAFGFELHDVK
jgi:hypothetical protein